ncbi:restriction endonuclease subunit S [Staphylococcus sp. 11261D007BR]
MSEPKTNVPELRFPEFTGEWEEKKLGDISNRVKRKNLNLESKKPLTISGQLGLIDQIEYFSKSVSSKNLSNYTLLKKGEFAYNKSYSNGYPLGAIKQLTRYDQGVLSSLYICFDFINEVNKSMMRQYFETNKWHKGVSSIAVEGARNHGLLNIPVNDFFSIKLSIPSNSNEQEKIGAFFSKLDKQIELEEQKLELLEQQKKGYMQKIFSQALRFKDENGNDYPEWEEKKLGEIGDTYTGLSGKTKKDFGYGNSYFITYKNVFKNTIAEPDMIEQVNIDKNEKQNEVHYKDIFFTTSSEIPEETGMSSIWLYKQKNIYLNSFCFGFRVTFKDVEPIYLARFLRNEEMRRRITILSQGSTRFNVSKKEIIKLKIKIPTLEEQIKITKLFNRIDSLIEKQASKIQHLKQRKQGLLQKMFI